MNETFNIVRTTVIVDNWGKEEEISMGEAKEALKNHPIEVTSDYIFYNKDGYGIDGELLLETEGLEVSIDGEFLFLNV